MFRWIVGSSLKFRFLVVAAAVAMTAFGFDVFRGMPVDVFPEFAPPRVEIQTISVGLSTTEVEELVTIPLEQAFNGLPGLDIMRSKSVPQLSSIILQFERGTDLLEARQLVAERLETVVHTLPTWAAPPVMIQPLSSTSRMMKIGISSKTMSLEDMSMTAYWKIAARLLRVSGVANVAIWGERLKMLTVQVEPERLRAHNLSLDQVMETTADSVAAGLLRYSDGARIGTGGFIDTPNQRLQIKNTSPIITPDAMAQVPVEGADEPLVLGDVAKVSFEHQPMIGDGIVNDGPGLLLIVEKFPWANTLQVTRGVEAAIDELRPGLPGMDIDTTIFRPATFIEVSIDNLTSALITGAILVIVVLGAFLFEWRSALISVVAIPLSLVAAGLVLYVTGATINVMILAGLIIALGAVVDDAIVYIENIVRRLRQHRREGSDKSTATIILEASLEIRSAIVYATLIIVLAVVPVFFLGGLSGAFFEPLALSYVLALTASMAVALTVTPALSLMLLSDVPLERRESPLIVWLQRGYHRFLARIIRSPRPAYATVGVIAVLGIALWPMLGHELLPSFKERDFLMHWLTKPGTSHPEMNRITIQGSRELRSIPGVRNFGAHIGQAFLMDEVVGIYFGENWISVDPNVDYDETVAKIQEVVDGYPGLYRDVLTYLKERIREVLTAGSGEAIVIHFYGPELDVLRTKAQEIRDAIAPIDGVVDLHVELQGEVPQVEIQVDLEKAQRYGIKPGDVRRAAATLISGVEVGDIYEHHGRTYEVYLWSTPETRSSVTDIRELLIDTPSGGHVRLEDVADVRVGPLPNVVVRENMSRKINIEANVRGRDLASVAQDIRGALAKVEFPAGYYWEEKGEYVELEAARQHLLIASVVAAVGIFLLLQLCFGSWRLATLAFLTLPSALVGGVIAVFMSVGVVSLGALVGFLTVFGIAARNSILLIDHCQHLERYEGETFGPEMVLRGARERLAPILMTAITTAAALLPLVVVGEIPGHEIEYPMALVIVGGLVTSTLLNLFVVPSLYLRFGGPKPQAETLGSQPVPAAR